MQFLIGQFSILWCIVFCWKTFCSFELEESQSLVQSKNGKGFHQRQLEEFEEREEVEDLADKERKVIRKRRRNGKRRADKSKQLVHKEGGREKSDIHPAPRVEIAKASNYFICKDDTLLTEVASNSPTRAIMYIISHNALSDEIAKQYRDCYGNDWINTARLSKSVYFESVIYQTFFPEQESVWKTYDYVVTATYKTLTRHLLPRYMPLQTMQQVRQMLSLARDEKTSYDVYPFFRDFEQLLPTSIKYHGPNFLKVWHLLLQQLGYSQETIQKFYFVKGFYRNAFVIRPAILQRLMKFMQQAMSIAESDEEIRQLLRSDAHYVLGKKEIAREVFNTSYYQLYPFVFERLPIFFLYANNVRICIGPDTPCKYNYKG